MVYDIFILCSTNEGADSVIPMYLSFYLTKLGYLVYMSNNEHDENLEELMTTSKVVIPVLTDSFKSDPLCSTALMFMLALNETRTTVVPIICNTKNDSHWLEPLFQHDSFPLTIPCIDLSDIYNVLLMSFSTTTDDLKNQMQERWIATTINKRITNAFLPLPRCG